MGEFISAILPVSEMQELVTEMRRNGYNVESTPLGYICHEQTRNGVVLVMSALRGNQRYRVKANIGFFETPPNALQ